MGRVTEYAVQCGLCPPGVMVGYDTREGICCKNGHVYASLESAALGAIVPQIAAETGAAAKEAETVTAPGSRTDGAVMPPELCGPGGAHAAVDAVMGSAVAAKTASVPELGPMVWVGQHRRLLGGDVLFGLRIAETFADSLLAYAEERQRPGQTLPEAFAELMQERVLQAVAGGWWR